MNRRHRASKGRVRAKTPGRWFPTKSAGRSGRMPLTLLPDASSGANAYNALTALARSMQAIRPCYARQLQRVARQLKEGLTDAGAIAAWTETPSTGDFTEVTLTEVTLSDVTLSELTFSESSPFH